MKPRRSIERGIVSFPKCGRTWIRLFLEYYRRFTGMGRAAIVGFSHGDRYDIKRRVLLIRHPCDAMVSYHLHRRVRRKAGGPLSVHIRSEGYGIPCFNSRYVAWSKREDDQLVVRYEDLFSTKAWVDMLEFWGIPLYREAFDEAIEKTRFDNIRANLAEIATFPSAWRYLAAEHGNYSIVKPENPEAHKFRRGKVGGYVDYMDAEDIEYILANFTLGENLESYRQQYLLESEAYHG